MINKELSIKYFYNLKMFLDVLTAYKDNKNSIHIKRLSRLVDDMVSLSKSFNDDHLLKRLQEFQESNLNGPDALIKQVSRSIKESPIN